jgi:hypothetical protein
LGAEVRQIDPAQFTKENMMKIKKIKDKCCWKEGWQGEQQEEQEGE